MRYVSLFSGIEAASVAWAPLGWEPVAFSEIDPYCCRLLAERFPNVPNLGDITKIEWEKVNLGTVDIVCGGSPCQSFSIAGKRESLQGESRLMFEFIRAIQAIRPRILLWENVPGCLTAKGLEGERGGAFRQLLRELGNIGYCLAWRVLDAQFFGVPQRRRRVFLIGSLGDERAAEILFEPESMRGDYLSGKEKREELTAASGRSPYGVHDYTIKLRHTGSPNIGGGSGPLVQTDVSATLATGQDQTLLTFSKTHRGMSKDDYTGYERSECAATLNCFDTGESRANEIVCMADTQANTSITEGNEAIGSLTRHNFKDPPVICMASDTSNAAIDNDLCGTIHVGGGGRSVRDYPEIIGALQARDFKGVGNQYVQDGKVIVQFV